MIMKTLYKCFALLLALGCCEVSLASSDPDSSTPQYVPTVQIVLSNTESGSQVCQNNSFTARAVVSNTSTVGLEYQWLVGRGTVNGSGTSVRTTSNTVTCVVTLPLPQTTDRANIVLQVFRGNTQIATDVLDFTLLPQVTPALPGNIAVNAAPPSPNGAVCQFSSVTFSVPSVPGAYSYVWSATGISNTSSSRSFTVSFGSSGNKTISVRAIGCAGTSPARTTNVFVIPSNQAPCDEPFAVAAPVATFPNPATTTFALAVPESYVTATAQLTSQETGKAVKTFTVTGTTTQVATNDLPSGVYLLTVLGKEGKITKRIIVQ